MNEGLLFPPLPHRIESRAPAAARDVSLQQFVRHATVTKDTGRVDACRAAFGERYDDLRRHAGAIKSHTLDHLRKDRPRDAARAAPAPPAPGVL